MKIKCTHEMKSSVLVCIYCFDEANARLTALCDLAGEMVEFLKAFMIFDETNTPSNLAHESRHEVDDLIHRYQQLTKGER